MKDKVNKKNTLLKLVKEAMRVRGWKQVDLIRESGVNQGTVSRFLGGTGISAKNIGLILTTLDLLKDGRPETVFPVTPRKEKAWDKYLFARPLREAIEEGKEKLIIKFMEAGLMELEGESQEGMKKKRFP